MGDSKLLRATCLTVAGVATAWSASTAEALPPPFPPIDYTIGVTSNATMGAGESVSNPHFIYASNTSVPVAGAVSMLDSDYQPLTNPTSAFSILGHDDNDSPFHYDITYTVIGLAPNGDLVAGLNAGAASAAVSSGTSFDTLFGAGSEAALLAALGADDHGTMAAFAASHTENASLNTYTYFNDPFPTGGTDPKSDSLTLVDFGHGIPANSSIGTDAFTLATNNPFAVPEPATLAVLGAPLLLLMARRRRR